MLLPEDVRFAYFHSYWNLPELLKSSRIGCTHCGYIFIYDGTEETAPQSMDGKTGVCPVCSFPALVGDASGLEISGENLMRRIVPYRRKLDLPPEEQPEYERFALEIPDRPETVKKRGEYSLVEAVLILACGNRNMVAQANQAWCFSCQKIFVPEPIQELCALCPACLAPTVLPNICEAEQEKIMRLLQNHCQFLQIDAM